MKYRLEYKSTLEQEIWNTDTNKLVIAFTKDDFTVEFNPRIPELIVQHMNDNKSTDKYDQRELISALFELAKTNNQKQNELIDVIEGLKAGGKALSFILPPPVNHPNDCITTSELYKTQYTLAKDHWGAYYARFYEKNPTDKDYLVQHVHRSDLSGIRSVDGEWYMTISIGGKGIRKYLGKDENVAKRKRDEIIKKITQ
jgi:hypothetical protein